MEVWQLASASLVVSTALLGLSGVFAAQLRLSPINDVKERITDKDYDYSKKYLFLSMLMAPIAIFFGFLGLYLDSCGLAFIASIFSMLQVVFFMVVIFKIFAPWQKSRGKSTKEQL
jgi:hypothetical protein